MQRSWVGTLFSGVAAVAVVALVVLWGCTVNPVTGKQQLDLMGEAQEIQLGQKLYPRYTQSSLGEVPDPQLQAYVNQVGLRLAEVGHRPELPYTYNAVNDPMVNAYALPGGKISITRGLLARFESEDELAAVLGHETGHVTARHSAQQYTRAMLVQALVVGGALYMEHESTKNRQLYTMGAMVGAQLVLARYSRDQERQSDELGFQYMVDAGYNPRGMVRTMDVLAESHSREPNFVERMFMSHPLTEERYRTASAAVAALPQEVLDRPLKRRPYLDRLEQVRAARGAYDRLGEARGLLADDKDAQARTLLQQSVDEWPNDGVLRAFLAATEMELDHHSAALTHAAKAAQNAPDIFLPQAVAAEIYLAHRRWHTALARLDRADELIPDVPDVVLMRGRALEGKGQRSEAIEAYRRVLQLAPDSKAGQEASQRLRELGVAGQKLPPGQKPPVGQKG